MLQDVGCLLWYYSFVSERVLKIFLIIVGDVCLFQCQPTALLRALGSAQGGELALSVVYFQFTHRLGIAHYVWDEYLYSILEEFEVRMTARVTVCVV